MVTKKILDILSTVTDPEIPVLSVIDLGIIRDVMVNDDTITILVSPTYSGCPAMDMISMNIKLALITAGFHNVQIQQVLSPAWTTDWMTESGKQKLKGYGIAPPVGKSFDKMYLEELEVACPQCHSTNTTVISEFGSTSCKALFKCNDCKEPFDYFKCH
ncbi:MAG: 1,2-phenylacetyl-CoA epoxidase subunit PaaD [Sediminibacterium sp.]|jgi:ring-1,2-phenylacetyl-CoA epoxidase subunit PaaD|nr:phenylacetate-CoA oxygenase subunit PaaJ [Chitinophagaceae bacterium]MCA6448282.1 phenylacetate-CoA oxygenase subunit PaaJ [Chitinophagaceae bacterium]